LASYANGTLQGVQTSLTGFADNIKAGLNTAKRQMVKTTQEIKDMLVQKIRATRAYCKNSIEKARDQVTKTLDDTLVVVYRKVSQVHDSIKKGIMSLQTSIQNGVNMGFDMVQTALRKTIAAARDGLNQVASYLKGRVQKAFAELRSALSVIADKAHHYVNYAKNATTMPPMSLEQLLQQYVCEPLEAYIVAKIESATDSLNSTKAHYDDIEQRNLFPPEPITRRLGTAALSKSERLSEQIAAWWQQEDEKSIMAGIAGDPTELSARHMGVMMALQQLEHDISAAHKQKAREKFHESTKMLMGLTSKGKVQLEVFDTYGMTFPAEDLMPDNEVVVTARGEAALRKLPRRIEV